MQRKPIRLESDGLTVTILPDRGAKTQSIRNLRTGHELLAQESIQTPGMVGTDDYANMAYGWDDCWPTIHGDLWRIPATIIRTSSSSLEVEIVPAESRWRYSKTWTLRGDEILVGVCIENLLKEELPGFWTLHALIRLEDDMRLIFPADDRRLTIRGKDFTPGALPANGEVGKFWLPDKVERGYCGIEYPNLGMSYVLQWDPNSLPYLGYWVSVGGYNGMRHAAWELSDGFHDTVEIARSNGALPSLGPGEKKMFEFSMSWTETIHTPG